LVEKSKKLPIFVISLQKSKRRRERSSEILTKLSLDFEFVDAVDGMCLTQHQIEENYDAESNILKFKRPMTRPEIGCYRSHRAIWKKMQTENIAIALILEDDFDVKGPLADICNAVLKLDLKNCLVKFNNQKFSTKHIIGNITENATLFCPASVQGLTTGYLLDNFGASNLLLNSAKFSRPVDMDIKHWWEMGINVLAVHPNLIFERNKKIDSSIQQSRNIARPKSLEKRFWGLGKHLEYHYRYRTTLRAEMKKLSGLTNRLKVVNKEKLNEDCN